MNGQISRLTSALIILDRPGILCHSPSLPLSRSTRKVSIQRLPPPNPYFSHSKRCNVGPHGVHDVRKMSKSVNARYTAACCSCSSRSEAPGPEQNIIREFDERSLVNYCTRACTWAEKRGPQNSCARVDRGTFSWMIFVVVNLLFGTSWREKCASALNQRMYILFYIVFFPWRMKISNTCSFPCKRISRIILITSEIYNYAIQKLYFNIFETDFWNIRND